MNRDKIVLVGMMGAGKSTLGGLAAERMGMVFVDADEVFVREAGMPVADFFRRFGEPEFRRRELETLAGLVRDPRPMIIAAGGGSFCQDAVRRHLLDSALTVFLHVGREELLRRLENGGVASRPMLAGGDWRRRVEELVDVRYPLYGEAHLTLDIGDEPAERSAERLAELLAATTENGEDPC